MLFPREFTLIFSIYYYLNVSTVCPGLKAISSNIQLNKTKMLLLKCYLKCNSLCNRLRMSDSDDDWTGFLGEQTDSEDDQPIRAKHIMQDRKRKISSSNQPKISKKSKTDFEVSFE